MIGVMGIALGAMLGAAAAGLAGSLAGPWAPLGVMIAAGLMFFAAAFRSWRLGL